jgi:hypothetical protein
MGSGNGWYMTPGDLHWTAGGFTYVVLVENLGGSEAVVLLSCTDLDCSKSNNWTFEAWLDSELDITGPTSNDDTTIHNYLASTIVPSLTAWIAANPALTDGMVVAPTSTLSVPTSWTVADRISALLPEWVGVSPFGAYMAVP